MERRPPPRRSFRAKAGPVRRVGVHALACPQNNPAHRGIELQPRPAVLDAGAPMEASFSEVWVAHGDLLGRVILRDDIRPESAVVVEALRSEGLRTVVLTGDRKATAK